jgi:hypothetical protein
MTRTHTIRRGMAVGVAAWLAVAPLAIGPAAAATPGGKLAAASGKAAEDTRTPAPEGLGSIRGVLFKEDEVTRISGSTVTAINVRTGRRYVSNFTGDNGAYEVGDLPAGTYDLAIDAAGRVYVTDNLVDLAEGQRLYLSFSLRPPTAGATDEGPIFKGGAKMTFTDPSAVPQAEETTAKKSFWKRPGGIAIISILVAGGAAAAVSAQQSD